jgi:hypothetical protein
VDSGEDRAAATPPAADFRALRTGARARRSGMLMGTIPHPEHPPVMQLSLDAATTGRCESLPGRARALCALGTALTLGFAAPSPATGQHAAELRAMARAGLLTPADWLYEEFSHFGIDPLEWTQGAIRRAPVAGIAAELALPGMGAWLRAELMRTLGAETTLRHAILLPPAGFEPPRVVSTFHTLPTTLTTFSLDLALPTRLMLPLHIQPYVTAGAGGKRLAFDRAPLQDAGSGVIAPGDGTVFLLHVGAGAALRRPGIGADLVVRDGLSTYGGRRQHDVHLLLSASVRLR